MEEFRIIKRFNRLPFFCGIQDAPYKGELLPDYLPFSLGYHHSMNLFMQEFNEKVQRVLEKAYLFEGLFATTPIETDSFTRWRADEFLNLIRKIPVKVKGKNVLEIGCSTGYLLHTLKKSGAVVRGCEPGPAAQVAVRKYNIPVDQIFFDPDSYDYEFDIVYLLTVLEHVVNPSEFLSQITCVLKPGGIILVMVPDCSREIIQGDPGMIMHEHWSYFTETSLKYILESNGFFNVTTCKTDHGTLYGWGTWDAGSNLTFREESNGTVWEHPEGIHFAERFDRIIDSIDTWFQDAKDKEKRIGLYGASNGAANILSLTRYEDLDLQIYDGDVQKQGKFLPCCPIQIQPPLRLKNNPVDSVLIVPMNFSSPIRSYLKEELRISPDVSIYDLGQFMH